MPPLKSTVKLAKKVHRFFEMDTLVVTRVSGTVDAEGDATAARTTVASVTKGTLYAITETEDLAALQRGTRVDKALGLKLGLDVRGGDFVTVNGGTTYEVVEMAQLRIHQRALLRIVA